jgi:two-component system chemotaxis response regulator CheB
VAEATHGARLLPGHVYLAPGGFHLRLGRSGANYVCQIGDDPPVSGHRPSVDALFLSVAECAGKSAIGVILTGMGRDGADGLLRMREAGAHTIGEHESTAMIYGMPKAAAQIGATMEELPIDKIAPQILALSNTQRLRI